MQQYIWNILKFMHIRIFEQEVIIMMYSMACFQLKFTAYQVLDATYLQTLVNYHKTFFVHKML